MDRLQAKKASIDGERHIVEADLGPVGITSPRCSALTIRTSYGGSSWSWRCCSALAAVLLLLAASSAALNAQLNPAPPRSKPPNSARAAHKPN
jgi:hypothetical protein